MWYMISLIIIIIIIGFIIIVIDVRKSVNEYNFTNEYYGKFTNLVSDVLKKKTFKNKEYAWLMSNSDKMQNILGEVGIISYMERNRMHNNIPILLNVMNEMISYVNDSYVSENDIKMINWCENAFLRKMGILDEYIKNEPKKSLNPFYDLAKGIKCILGIPIDILYSMGLISYVRKSKIQQNIIFRLLSGLLSLVTIFSTIMSIFVSWDEFVEIIKNLINI